MELPHLHFLPLALSRGAKNGFHTGPRRRVAAAPAGVAERRDRRRAVRVAARDEPQDVVRAQAAQLDGPRDSSSFRDAELPRT